MANYNPAIPEIVKAYQNDPRTQLAQNMIQSGTSTAPVAGGGWAWADGIARALQGVSGAFIQRKQQKKYKAEEDAYKAAIADAILSAGQTGATQQTGVDAASPGFGIGGSGPDTGQGVSAPQAPANLTRTPPPKQPVSFGPQPVDIPPSNMVNVPKPNIAPGRNDSVAMFTKGIVPLEGGTDPKTGAFRISPKGAVGPAQVMPKTAPEAARLAGLPWDERRYRSDPEYNLALGQAYFSKQLETFGDPALAAAAYNAGPGKVRRAVRQARKGGGEWLSFVPAETQEYVTNFMASQGGSAEPVAQGAPVQAPQMEAVPDAPQAPTVAPQAPKLPDMPKSERLAIARKLIQSGNPYLIDMAKQYMDKGLDDQQQNQRDAVNREFDQGQTRYGAELQDYTGSRSDARKAQYDERRDTQERNFQREQLGSQQGFTREQTIRAERQSMRELGYSRQTSLQLAQLNNDAEYQRTLRVIEGKQQSDAEKAAEKRAAFLYTATGAKQAQEAENAVNKNNTAIGMYSRFMKLNETNSTGGAAGVPVLGAAVRGVRGAFDSEFSEMGSIANDTTFSKLGGSLGVAVSDADRKFVQDSNISTEKPKQANDAIAKARIRVLERDNEFQQERINAIAEGRRAEFIGEWRAYVNSVSVRSLDKNYQSFGEWRLNRNGQGLVRYDANGNKVQ